MINYITAHADTAHAARRLLAQHGIRRQVTSARYSLSLREGTMYTDVHVGSITISFEDNKAAGAFINWVNR